MSDLTADDSQSIPRGGVTGVALELLSSTARGVVNAQLSLLRLPLIGVQQVCSVTEAVVRITTGVAERGLQLVGLRALPADDEGFADPLGYLAEPESRNGEYAQFNPDFSSGFDAESDTGLDAVLSDEDADLIVELGTDIGADLDPAAAEAAAATLAAADLAAADLAAELAAAEFAGGELTPEDVEAAVADLEAAAHWTAGGAPAAVAAVDVPAAPTVDAPADSPSPPAADAPDIVTRAAAAAEEAAADGSLPHVDLDALPIEDFDHVTAGSLRGRLRRLDLDQLHTLRIYEQDHGRRLPILTLLENRIAKLEALSTV